MAKHGDVRDDGMVFWGMSGKHEDWRSPDKFYAAKNEGRRLGSTSQWSS